MALAAPAVAQDLVPVQRGSEPFAVGTLKTELNPDAKVGRKRAGMLCVAAGALRWREVEPVGNRARAAVARAVRDAGVAIDAPDEDDWLDYRVPSTGYRLIGDVVGIKASMCAPAYGVGRLLGSNKRLKGEGRMRVEWRIYRLADHRGVARTETCAAFRFDRPGMSPSDVGQAGMIENARVLGAALARSPRAFTLPASLIADGESCPPRVEGHQTPTGAADVP